MYLSPSCSGSPLRLVVLLVVTSPQNQEAIIFESESGRVDRFTFNHMKLTSDKLASGLRAIGVKRVLSRDIGAPRCNRTVTQGDRIAILLPQSPETAIAHISTYKLGCVAVPL
jgi:acetyl-CoA synthetase